jgi:hypothetical protein
VSNDQLSQYFERAVADELTNFYNEHFQDLLEQTAEREAAENEEYLSREIAWYEKQKDIVRQGDILLINVGDAVWKLPAIHTEFVKRVLPIFARRLKGSETRYALYKSMDGVEVAVHRLYLQAGPEEQIHAFDGDLTNFCDVKVRYEVERNFGLTPPQQTILAQQYAESTCHNLYLSNSTDNPSYARAQTDFERDCLVMVGDVSRIKRRPIEPNADLAARAGTPYGVQRTGRFAPLRPAEMTGVDRFVPRTVSVRYLRAAAELDRLMSG